MHAVPGSEDGFRARRRGLNRKFRSVNSVSHSLNAEVLLDEGEIQFQLLKKKKKIESPIGGIGGWRDVATRKSKAEQSVHLVNLIIQT